MSAIDRRQVQRHFSASAAGYDDCAAVQKKVAHKVAGMIRSAGPLGGRFLEVGTGTGFLARIILEQNPGCRGMVSDLAHAMTLTASTRLPEAWAADLDATALPLRSGSMALVCSASVYQWVENLPAAFRESRRVLQPGGAFVFALFGIDTLHELKRSYREAMRIEGAKDPDYLLTLPDTDTVASALGASGFTDFHVHGEHECENHPSLESLLKSIKGVGAHNASQHRPRGLASRRVMRRLGEIYHRRYAEGGMLPATYHVIYGVARKT